MRTISLPRTSVYAVMKIALHFLQYWPYFLSFTVVLVITFTVLGAISAPLIRLRPFAKHFYIPVLSAVGLLLFNAAVEFTVALAITIGRLVSGT